MAGPAVRRADAGAPRPVPPDPAGALPAPARRTPQAGRNVPVAVAVGLCLGALLTVPLYTARPVFVAIIVVAAG